MVGLSGGVARGGEAAHWPCPHPSCTDEETDLRGRVTYPQSKAAGFDPRLSKVPFHPTGLPLKMGNE